MLNWKSRYSKIIRNYPELKNPEKSILEVGCGPYGLTYQLQRPVQGIELEPVPPQSKWLTVRKGSVLDLPYHDAAFDFVICLDVVEHLKKSDRYKAFIEMARVAGDRVIISCPYQDPGEDGERELAKWLRKRLKFEPGWLTEHFRHGLPSMAEMMNHLIKLNLPFDLFGNEGMLQHYGALLLDFDFPISKRFLERQHLKNPFEEPIAASDWDEFYSYAICIYKGDIRRRSYTNTAASSPVVSSDQRVAIYAACHDSSLVGNFGKVTPLLTGVAADNAQHGELTDILADGSRLENGRWSELSGIFKVWQEGPKSEVVGFCHYRRHFNFSSASVGPAVTTIKRHEIDKHNVHFFSEEIHDACMKNTVYLPHQIQLHEESPFAQYAVSHNADDLCKIITLISKNLPELLPYTANLFNGNSIYGCNMFVMKWSVFDQLCQTWFGVLRDFESIVPSGRATTYQNRDISFLAERLFDVWVRYAADKLNITLQTVPTYFVEP